LVKKSPEQSGLFLCLGNASGEGGVFYGADKKNSVQDGVGDNGAAIAAIKP